MLKKVLFVLTIVLLASCLPDPPEKRGFSRAQLRRLLSLDQQKIWLLTNRQVNDQQIDIQACGFDQFLVLRAIGTVNNPDSLYYFNFNLDCERNDTATQIRGRYFIPTLQPLETTQDTVYFYILGDTIEAVVDHITHSELRIRYQLDSINYLRESFILFEFPEEEEDI